MLQRSRTKKSAADARTQPGTEGMPAQRISPSVARTALPLHPFPHHWWTLQIFFLASTAEIILHRHARRASFACRHRALTPSYLHGTFSGPACASQRPASHLDSSCGGGQKKNLHQCLVKRRNAIKLERFDRCAFRRKFNCSPQRRAIVWIRAAGCQRYREYELVSSFATFAI